MTRGLQPGQREPIDFEPLSVRIPVAVRLTGISRSRLYLLIQAGELQTVKIGRSTLITYPALKALVAGQKSNEPNDA
jgi:excisionase family DNA binding protein